MKTLFCSLWLVLCLPTYAADTAVAQGMKQALNLGVETATSALSKPDAYYRSAFRIPFPPEARAVATTLNKLGMQDVVDKVVLTLNRAAENSASQAKPIFLQAIREMSIADALQMLRGPDTAATDYLRAHTHEKLAAAYRPTVQSSLDKTQATRYWKQAMSAYNQVPFVQKINPDLTGYVTERALDALFVKVGEEEKRIRQNPTARVTTLLRDVFGHAGR